MPESSRPAGSRKFHGFFSPAPGKISEHKKTVLSHAYAAVREGQKGSESPEAKAKAARIAWAATKKA